MKIRGGALVAKTLKRFGVDFLFSLPGHQTLSVFDACIDEGLKLISTRHEASAMYMAEGLAYATRDVGVALLAGGPELTNALTGLAKAYYSNTPLLVIAGTNTMKKLDKGFPQDMNQLELVRPFTKWCKGCYDGARIPEYIGTAYRHAVRGRPGPSYLEIPYDVLEASVSEAEVCLPEKPLPLRGSGDRASLDAAARLLADAERPIIIAGSGAFWSGAESELQQFVEQTGIPLFVTTAALSMKLPSELVFGYGIPALGRYTLRAIAQADAIMLLGTRVNFLLGFGQEPFISSRQKIIQIDAESTEIGEHRAVDVGIVGDIRECLKDLDGKNVRTRSLDAWRAHLRDEKQAFEREIAPLKASDRVPVHPLRLVKEIEQAKSAGTLVVLDGANSVLWALTGMEPGDMVVSPMGNLEAIGAGVPHALALKLAHPDRPVILHTGDGSFGYGVMEFETAVRHNIPILAIVHNDQGWGMTRDMQTEYYGPDREIGNWLGPVRYDRVVEALGGYGELIERPEEIQVAIQRALDSGRPACVNVMVDPAPKSPGLMMFMIMEVMLGKETYYDRVPELMRRLKPRGLDDLASRLMLRYVERQLHRELR